MFKHSLQVFLLFYQRIFYPRSILLFTCFYWFTLYRLCMLFSSLFILKCIWLYMSSPLGIRGRETYLMAHPHWIIYVWMMWSLGYFYFRVGFFQYIYVVCKSRENSDADHILKEYASVPRSGFLNNWVRGDTERVSRSQLRNMYPYRCLKDTFRCMI